MRLAAIYNVFDGEELLRSSMLCLKDHVDLFIIVYQDVSNFGEYYNPDPYKMCLTDEFNRVEIFKYEPRIAMGGAFNEKAKRNIGLDIARREGCTHFIHMDCDEYYENFGEAKRLYAESGCAGSVCRLHTYFAKPTLRLETPENYFVPFIHELKPDTMAGASKYPFYCDPTRRVNETDVVELPIWMHHFSYVRRDMHRKINNSSAKANILKRKDVLFEDLRDAKPGYYCRFYQQKLIEVPDLFNIGTP